ncbi:MAG: CRISPR-associated protein [Oscillatoriales cyanobacterium SM2_3_0]|nr:CRISPR-associated protein [Oscillatoriales cyanobacterium SM2_3_0]
MNNPVYTVVTFSPVQSFIEKSRKLRDLYGSSYILSFLSWVICQVALKNGFDVVSPALPNITQGMPNQIILKGSASRSKMQQIEQQFNQAWRFVAESCQDWLENPVVLQVDDSSPKTSHRDYKFWKRSWDSWKNYAWEFFYAIGKPDESITEVREKLNQVKAARDWTGINWQGESSTLSGTDAITYPEMGQIKPLHYNYQEEKTKIQAFYSELNQRLNDSFIDRREQLNIPELIKRLITHENITDRLRKKLLQLEIEDESEQVTQISKELNPKSFRDLNRLKDDTDEEKYWTGWFLGDGDGAAKYFKSLADKENQEEDEFTNQFSKEMREWGQELIANQKKYLSGKGRMVYAGGDDFLGVLYKADQQIPALDCLQWFYQFKSQVWHKPERKKITPSVGFVWAGPQVPQRDVLQHCNLAEKSAKGTGRDRIAFRILFNSGNHLDWVCPWWLLDMDEFSEISDKLSVTQSPTQNLIESYQDRDGGKNWTHFYQDIAILESRHAFQGKKVKDSSGKWIEDPEINLAESLLDIYLGSDWQSIISNPRHWFNLYSEYEIQKFTGILGDPKNFDQDCQYHSSFNQELKDLAQSPKAKQAFNNWVISLAKVGFHLTKEPQENHERK